MSQRKNLKCLNCESSLIPDAEYCPQCGQAKKESRLDVSTLFRDFFSQVFNVDGRIFLTLRKMWKPAFLTKEYVSGRRVSYFNPARFFITMLILHFILISYDISHSNIKLNSTDNAFKINTSNLAVQYDSLIQVIIPEADTTQVDSLRKSLFKGIVKPKEDFILKNFTVGETSFKKYKITRTDAYTLDFDKLYKKYEINSGWHQMIVRQYIRVTKNAEGSLPFLIGNLSWGVILLLFTIAGFMWLLYFRGGYYYVEHCVLLLYYHAKAFLVINVFMIIEMIFSDHDFPALLILISYGLSVIYLYVTMKMYYQQGWFKTLIKFALVGFAYFIFLLIFATMVSAVSAAIF